MDTAPRGQPADSKQQQPSLHKRQINTAFGKVIVHIQGKMLYFVSSLSSLVTDETLIPSISLVKLTHSHFARHCDRHCVSLSLSPLYSPLHTSVCTITRVKQRKHTFPVRSCSCSGCSCATQRTAISAVLPLSLSRFDASCYSMHRTVRVICNPLLISLFQLFSVHLNAHID